MELKQAFVTENQIISPNHLIRNEMIQSIDVEIIGHFGNICCLRIRGTDHVLMNGYNNTVNLGYVLRSLIELFDLAQENGVLLKDLKNIPCRIIVDAHSGLCIGFGHWMKDKFVYIGDLVKIDS